MTNTTTIRERETEVSKQEFKNVAPWTKEERILSPALFTVGIAGILVGLGVIPTDGLASTGWTVGVPLLVVGLYALWTSYSRKKKSTLFTTVNGRKVHVWMKKPSKVRWDNRLSEGVNVADLSNLSLVSFEEVNGTKVFRLHADKTVIIPWRIVGADTEAGEAVKALLTEELAVEGRKVKFHDEATEKSVRGWIAGEDLVFVSPKKAARPDYNRVGTASPVKTKPGEGVASTGDTFVEEPAQAVPVKPQRHIGYQKYNQAPALDVETTVEYAVNSGIASLEESELRKVEEEQEILPGYAGNLLLGDSVTIVVDDKK